MKQNKASYYPKRKSVAKAVSGSVVRQDGFFNKKTGFGGQYDALTNTNFVRNKWMNQEELDALYDGNWLAKRAVEAPISDMFSNWITFIKKNEEESDQLNIDKVEETLQDFNVKTLLERAFSQSRLHWGSAIFFDYGDDPSMPLFEVRDMPVRMEVANSWHCVPTTYYRPDIYGQSHPKLGMPEHYQFIIQKAGFQETITVHESRLVIIQGLPASDSRVSIERRGWGFSVLEAMNDAMTAYGTGIQSSANVLQEFFWKILKMSDLSELIINNDNDTIVSTVAYAVNAMQSQNVGVFGEGDDLRRESASVGGIPEIIDRLGNQVCAAVEPGIPWSVFFSSEGGALGGTSAKSDLKNYYKRISSKQERELRPAINQVFKFLMIDPKEYPYIFNNLDEPTREEELQHRKTQMETDTGYINAGVLHAEEVAGSRFSGDTINLDQVVLDYDFRAEVEKEGEMVDEVEEGENQDALE